MIIDQGLINMARDEAKYTANEFPLKAKLFSDMADAMERLLAEVARLQAEAHAKDRLIDLLKQGYKIVDEDVT